MVAVLVNLYTLVKSEYVSFPIGMSALCHRSNCHGVVGLCYKWVLLAGGLSICHGYISVSE